VNLYPFERSVARRLPEEEIIGTSTSAADDDPRRSQEPRVRGRRDESESYDAVLDELRMSDGRLSQPTRESLAAEAFAYTAR